MRVVELVVPVDDAEVAADRLWLAGASAIEERDDERGVALRTVLSDDDATSRRRLGELPPHWHLGVVDVDDAPSQAWRDFARPVVVAPDLVIAPAWISTDRVEGVAADATVVAIEPAGSFGLGDHPTTRSSAAAVWRSVRPADRVLDVGCGSGVLAIVAVLRGAATAHGIDVAEAAREATLANAVANGVEDRVTAACTPLADIEGPFDVVVANILAPTLVALADDLRRVIRDDGRLIVSGILVDHHDHVLAALAPLRVVRTDVDEAWACVELVR